MSKGSKQRPIEDRKQFEENWDRIFNKPCSHNWVLIEDDFGSGWFCKNCGLKQNDL